VELTRRTNLVGRRYHMLLLDGGAFINSKDRDSRTPLSHAEMSGHKGVVKLLLDRGADRRLADEAGDTRKQSARFKEQTNTVDQIATNLYSTNITKKKGKRGGSIASFVKAFRDGIDPPGQGAHNQDILPLPRRTVVARETIYQGIDPVNSSSRESASYSDTQLTQPEN
jgi:hypothetical protein